MKYLWDTDSCVHFLNGAEGIIRKTQSIGAENICTTMVNIFELKFGAYNSNRPGSNLARIEKLRRILTILDDFDDEIGRRKRCQAKLLFFFRPFSLFPLFRLTPYFSENFF